MGFFDRPDPNDPMAAFQQAPPGLAEIIFKLAGSMAPLAPFIGGTRTPMGRMLGAGAVLGGGASNVMADYLTAQRLDPQAQQSRMIQSILAQGTKPTPGTPAQTVPFPAATTSDFYTPPEGGAEPTLNIPSTPSGPPTFDPKNLSLPVQAMVEKTFPALGQKYQMDLAKDKAEMEQAAIRSKLYEKQLNAPLIIPANSAVVDANDPSKTLRAATVSSAEQRAIDADKLETDFGTAVKTRAAAGTKPDKPMTMGQAANDELAANPGKWAGLPANNIIATQGREERQMKNHIEEQKVAEANHERRFKTELAAREAQHNRELGQKMAPGVFVDKENGIIREITFGEYKTNPRGFIKTTPVVAQDVELLSNAFPNIARLRELSTKILAKTPGKQFQTMVANAALHKRGVSPDVQEFYNRGVALNAELARAQSSGARVLGSIYKALQGESVGSITITDEVNQRELDTAANEIGNRVRSHLHQPLLQQADRKPGDNAAFEMPTAPTPGRLPQGTSGILAPNTAIAPGGAPGRMIYDKNGQLVGSQ